MDTFYTDSNGMAMLKRTLNKRPTWDLKTNETIAANYYPVTSAIVMRDTNQMLQMGVYIGRPQGGGVIKPGRIELMQNRRMFYDDDRGVGEALNETNKFGLGIITDNVYEVDFFGYGEETSLQRSVQLEFEQPVQVFYSFQQSVDVDPLFTFTENFWSMPRMGMYGLKEEFYPVDEETLLYRVENLVDKFEDMTDAKKRNNYKNYTVDLEEMTTVLWKPFASSQATLNQIYIEEMSIDGGMTKEIT